MAKTRGAKAGVLEDGTLMLFGVIGDEFDGLTDKAVVEGIRSLGKVEEIEVLINSPGGGVLHGLAIYHELATNPAKINVEIAGVAASMASAIAMAGDHIRIAKNGHVMIHDPWNVAVGNSEELRKAADLLDEYGTSLAEIYAERTGLPEDEIREMMTEETWMTAEEAKAKGFVDEIIEAAEPEAFADLDISELAAVPAALVSQIREGKKMARDKGKKKNAPAPADAGTDPNPDAGTDAGGTASRFHLAADARKAAQEAVAAERERVREIRGLAQRHSLPETWAATRIDAGDDIGDARVSALEELAKRTSSGGPSGVPAGVGIGTDERDKWLEGMADWLTVKAGYARLIEQHTEKRPDPGQFRGMSLLDIAREALHNAGVSTRGLPPLEIARLAVSPRAADPGLGTTSDFPILLENVLHKMLQAAYDTAPDQWRAVAATGSVMDFRNHPRLRLGSLSRLDKILESGEFRQLHFPDAEKEVIKAETFGNLVGLTRQAIVNDDLDGFSRLTVMLGRAAARSIEIDLFALFELNSGLGPTMADGNALFDAAHNNIDGTGGAPSVTRFEAMRVLMAQQQDPDNNDFLNLRPDVFVGPIGLGAAARTAIEAQFDFDAGGTNPQFMKPNIVRDLLSTIVDTPRLSGTRYYLLADPGIAPVFEVVFLQGMESPQIEVQEGFDYDGVRWRIRHDYGVGATDFRGAVTNAGA